MTLVPILRLKPIQMHWRLLTLVLTLWTCCCSLPEILWLAQLRCHTRR